MSFQLLYHLAVLSVILMHNMIFEARGQCTVEDCENGAESNRIAAEQNVEAFRHLGQQIQSMRELLTESIEQWKNLNASFLQMKNQQDTVIASFQATERRSQEQDICTKQVQSNHEMLNASFQQIQNQHAKATRRLDVVTQLLLYYDLSIKNETQNSWRLAIEGVLDQPDILLLSMLNDWIILMHRFDGSVNFNRSWIDYRNGFGDTLSGRGEFWLGNENIHRLTNRSSYTLRIEVQLKTNGQWYYADYETFSIDSESNKYAIRLSGFSGNAGDSLTNTSMPSIGYHGGMSFSTVDADSDRSTGNCAQIYGGGWWYNSCRYACLTCKYNGHFLWITLKDESSYGSLRAARMMIKSK